MKYHSNFWELGIVGKVIVDENGGMFDTHSTREVYKGIFEYVGKSRIFDTKEQAIEDCIKRRGKKILMLKKKIAELEALEYKVEE